MMGAYAERVHTDPASIEKLGQWVAELPANAHVIVHERAGPSTEGVVSARPTVQVFRDAEQREGMNAVVSLQRPWQPDWRSQIWLDQVQRIEHLDSTLASES